MTIFLAILSILILTLIIGKANYVLNFKKELNLLFANSKNISTKKYTHEQLVGLPGPVQRYFKHVLNENIPYISYVRLKHDGHFKPAVNKNWTDIKGEQYYTTATPGFMWKGNIGFISARDQYLNDKGSIVITFLNLINIKRGQGKHFDQGELLRWLGESVWFPTNLLPSNRLTWLPIDDTTAKLLFNYQELSLYFIVKFNEKDEITQLETERFFDNKSLKPWIGNFYHYKEINGIRIPTVIRASWRLEQGDHNYVIFNLEEIEYDIPNKY